MTAYPEFVPVDPNGNYVGLGSGGSGPGQTMIVDAAGNKAVVSSGGAISVDGTGSAVTVDGTVAVNVQGTVPISTSSPLPVSLTGTPIGVTVGNTVGVNVTQPVAISGTIPVSAASALPVTISNTAVPITVIDQAVPVTVSAPVSIGGNLKLFRDGSVTVQATGSKASLSAANAVVTTLNVATTGLYEVAVMYFLTGTLILGADANNFKLRQNTTDRMTFLIPAVLNTMPLSVTVVLNCAAGDTISVVTVGPGTLTVVYNASIIARQIA